MVQNKKHLLLKVMCDPDLFYAELSAVSRLQATGQKAQNCTIPDVTLRLKQWFQFQTPMYEDDGSQKDDGSESFALDHFYMLFEICRSNLFQIIAARKQKQKRLLSIMVPKKSKRD